MNAPTRQESRPTEILPRLRTLIGELRLVDIRRPRTELELDALWQEANSLVSQVFDRDSLRFYMFRQPSFSAALAHMVRPTPRSPSENLIIYRLLIDELIADLQAAIDALEREERV